MTPHMALYISPLVVSAAVLLALLVVTWRSRSDPVAPWFAATLVAFLIWTVGYVFEIVSASLGAKLWWADFEFIGIAVLPVVWFEVVRRYTGHGPLPRWFAAALGAFVVASVAVFLTNPGGIFRGAPSLDTTTAPAWSCPTTGGTGRRSSCRSLTCCSARRWCCWPTPGGGTGSRCTGVSTRCS